MSGHFEEPSGSESEQEAATRIVGAILEGVHSPHDISPSGELYRVIGRFHRVPRAALYTSNLFPLTASENMTPNQDLERRSTERNENELSSLFVLPLPLDNIDLPGISSSGSRPLIRDPLELGRVRMNRVSNRHLIRPRRNVNDGYTDLQQAGRQLEQASSNLRSLLNNPVAELPAPTLHSEPLDSDIRGTKRRKLNSDKIAPNFPGFSYGRFGQSEPGKLKMEVVSCDGGIFEDTDMQHTSENVLENENTGYCSKANRCNLILQHQGATVFCLKELCIKAPHSGYTAPVQEGMVFISMISDDLLARTARYQIQYTPLSSQQEFNTSDLPRIRSIRRGEEEFMTTAQNRARRLFDIGRQDEECNHRTAQIPYDFTQANAPSFNVTTECSDSDSEDHLTRPSNQRPIRSSLRFASSDDSESNDDDDNDDGDQNLSHVNYIRRINHINSRRGLRQRETVRIVNPADAAESPHMLPQDASKGVEGGLMAPHARFFIERDKSKCTVKFDPPVSGRFILLKMWSPYHDVSGNIDIQSVVAIGFAGPRYFPAIKWT